MGQVMSIQARASRRHRPAGRAGAYRHPDSRLADLLACHACVRVLADFRHTTGCLIIACPMAPPSEQGHRCAVICSFSGGSPTISCVHPACWHFTTWDFLNRLGLVRSGPAADEDRKQERLEVILAVLNHDGRPAASPDEEWRPSQDSGAIEGRARGTRGAEIRSLGRNYS
jgi:hypothetical protein